MELLENEEISNVGDTGRERNVTAPETFTCAQDSYGGSCTSCLLLLARANEGRSPWCACEWLGSPTTHFHAVHVQTDQMGRPKARNRVKLSPPPCRPRGQQRSLSCPLLLTRPNWSLCSTERLLGALLPDALFERTKVE